MNINEKLSDAIWEGTPIEALPEGTDVHWFDEYGWNLLHVAAQYGRADVVRMLLDAGADANAKTRQSEVEEGGNTALCIACETDLPGTAEIVQMLLEAGADVNHENEDFHRRPIHYAAETGRPDVIKMLLDAGSKTHGMDLLRRTPRQLAVKSGNKEAAALLQDAT